MKIHLLTKTDDWCDHAELLARTLFGANLCDVSRGERGDPPPRYGAADVIISFRSPWIIPKEPLEAAHLALNFHPGTRHYPGIGCYNFALYEGAEHYGAVCHHMEARVDSGMILEEQTFLVTPCDTVQSLKTRTMIVMLDLFQKVCEKIVSSEPLGPASISWTRKPFTWQDFEALRVVTPEMDRAEVSRRKRAVTYPGYPGLVRKAVAT